MRVSLDAVLLNASIRQQCLLLPTRRGSESVGCGTGQFVILRHMAPDLAISGRARGAAPRVNGDPGRRLPRLRFTGITGLTCSDDVPFRSAFPPAHWGLPVAAGAPQLDGDRGDLRLGGCRAPEFSARSWCTPMSCLRRQRICSSRLIQPACFSSCADPLTGLWIQPLVLFWVLIPWRLPGSAPSTMEQLGR